MSSGIKHFFDLPSSRWWTRRNRLILGSISVAVLVLLLGLVLVRHISRRGWPQTQGTITVAGLSAQVMIVRDANGVPHIFAETAEDAVFAQGYVHAQDRFWQMEMSRRRGSATLAQLLGERMTASDVRWASLGLRDIAQRILGEIDPDSIVVLDAYSAGVNAWLDAHSQELPLEFGLLSWRGGDVGDPVSWTTLDSLVVALSHVWYLGAPRINPSLAQQVAQRVGPQRAAFLLDAPSGDLTEFAADMPFPGFDELTGLLPRPWALRGRVTWISGDHTASGRPLFGVDLPSGLELPVPWYVMTWQVDSGWGAGASVPGVPGIVVGVDDAGTWESWPNPQYTMLSALRELSPGREVLPWQRWLVAALLSASDVSKAGDTQVPRSLDEFREYQQDTFSTRARRLVPLLLDVEPVGWRQERVSGMLRKWDFRIAENNKEAPFFVVYQLELARQAFGDELGDDLFEAYVAQSDQYQVSLDRLVENPDDPWWDDVTTRERERRDDIVQRAYEPALEWIGRNYGDLHMLWEWDLVHSSRLHHALGDIWPWDQLLSRDLSPDGWAATVNASPGGLPCTGGICLGGDLYRAKAVYGYRQILDGSDPSVLWFSLLPGQSGHAFHRHYDDLLDPWLEGKYIPLRRASSPRDVAGAEAILSLVPER